MKHVVIYTFALTMTLSACKKDKKESLATLNTTPITSLTSNSAATGGNISDDGGSAITKRGVCLATHPTPTVADTITADGSGSGTFITNLTNLNANTTYYLRAYAINATGTAYGNELNFTTSQGFATLTTTSISNIVALSAQSGGTISNDGGSSVTERGVVWSTSPNPTIANFKSSNGTGKGAFTSTLSPLSSQTTYYVRAYATNSTGIAYGNQVQFNAASASTVTDIEGNVYPYVTVCGKDWTATNLKVTKYKNGDAITNGLTNYNWSTSTVGAYTFPNGNAAKKDSLGLLYNLYAVNDSRGVCPTGWHVATDNDWKAIEVCMGMTQAQADGNDLRGTVGAKFLDGGSSGLNIKLSGYLVNSDGSYQSYGDYGFYMTSTAGPNGNYLRMFNVTPDGIYRTWNNGWTSSVRCVRD